MYNIICTSLNLALAHLIPSFTTYPVFTCTYHWLPYYHPCQKVKHPELVGGGVQAAARSNTVEYSRRGRIWLTNLLRAVEPHSQIDTLWPSIQDVYGVNVDCKDHWIDHGRNVVSRDCPSILNKYHKSEQYRRIIMSSWSRCQMTISLL